jgi:hypothetical protein
LPSAVHSVKRTCATRRGSTQCTPRAAAPRGGSTKAAVLRSSRLNGAPGLERRPVEAGADATGEAQASALERAHEQRANAIATAARLGESADHELLLGKTLRLHPVAAAPGAILRLAQLAHHALDRQTAGLAEEGVAAARDVIAVAQGRFRRCGEQPRQLALALVERQVREVRAVEVQEVEGDQAEGRAGAFEQSALQELKRGPPVLGEGDQLAVEQRRLDGQLSCRGEDRREAVAPILAAAREQRRATLLDPTPDAVAVELDLVLATDRRLGLRTPESAAPWRPPPEAWRRSRGPGSDRRHAVPQAQPPPWRCCARRAAAARAPRRDRAP